MRTVRIVTGVAALAALLLVVVLLAAAVAVLDTLVSLTLLAGVVVIAWLVAAVLRKRVARETVLEIDLDGGVVETSGTDPVSRAMNRNAVVVRDVVDALYRAADDARITGLVVRLGNGSIGLGHSQELRDAVHHFRQTGKKTIAFAETFGESHDATVDYYLAVAFETIYLQPMGGASVQGRLARTRFIRGALDRLGIYPDFDHREEYKAAMYMFTETRFTEPHREALGALVEDQFAQIVGGIATDRSLDEDEVRRLIDRAPLTSSEALESGLVDALGHRDEAYGASEGKRFMFHDRYLKRAGRPHRKGDRIALVFGSGGIQRGSPGFDPLTQGRAMGADAVAKALRSARDDKRVKAIVFRVDSPGGSAVASEVIRREVVRAQESGKPVVVSMGNVAGSGGYWIAVNADRIVALPGTITGSIGVVGGKLAARNAWARAGVTSDQLGFGENSSYWSLQDTYTDSERERMQVGLDDVYDRFTNLVSEARGMGMERVQRIAKGRIWTGAQASENGLVDELGGLETAIGLARELAGIIEDRPIRVKVFPEERAVPLPGRKQSSEPIEAAIGILVDAVRDFSGSHSGIHARMRDV